MPAIRVLCQTASKFCMPNDTLSLDVPLWPAPSTGRRSQIILGLTPGERMNRTLKEATVQRYHYGRDAQLKAHAHAFLTA